MKFALLFSALSIISISTFAQPKATDNTVTAKTDQTAAAGSKGVVVGLVYSNLTDVSSKSESTTTYNGNKYSYSDTDKGDTQAGIYGLGVGYKNNYAFGAFGFNAGGVISKGLNGSETQSKMTIYKTQGNVVLPLTDMFSIEGGLNISYFGGIDQNGATYQPGPGAQLGGQADFNKVGVYVGYQTIGTAAKFTGSNYEVKYEAYISGFVTQISYTF